MVHPFSLRRRWWISCGRSIDDSCGRGSWCLDRSRWPAYKPSMRVVLNTLSLSSFQVLVQQDHSFGRRLLAHSCLMLSFFFGVSFAIFYRPYLEWSLLFRRQLAPPENALGKSKRGQTVDNKRLTFEQSLVRSRVDSTPAFHRALLSKRFFRKG